MTRFTTLMTCAAFALLPLAACSNGGASASESDPAAVSALTEQLPELSGDYVWDVDLSQSTVEFEANYNGAFTGKFTAFDAVISLNSDAPEGGEIHAIVDLSSVSTKDSDVKSNLPTADWFNVAAHPYATFSSTNISALGGGNYSAKGEMTLKGISKPVDMTFSLSIEGDEAMASGGFDLNRMDFNVGSGSDFKTEEWVKFGVKVTVEIVATKS